MKKKNRFWIYPLFIMGVLLMFTNSCKKTPIITGTVTDIEGNVYHIVTIGTQTWMVENLKTTKYNDGTAIPNITDNNEWAALTTPAYCWYDNNISNKATYGALYNWYTVNTGKLAPKGWHIPTDAEWTILEDYLIANGFNYTWTKTGNKYAKAMASDTGWVFSSNTGAVGNTDHPVKRNATGFTGLPCGYRNFDGTYDGIGYYGDWWCANEDDIDKAWFRSMDYSVSDLYRKPEPKEVGFAIRCVRD